VIVRRKGSPESEQQGSRHDGRIEKPGRAARAVALFIVLALADAFFALYTDGFRRPVESWVNIVSGAAVLLTVAILIYWLGVPYRADEWFRFSARAKERWKAVPKRRKVVVYSNEVFGAIAFFAVYMVFRNPDGTRPLSYDLLLLAWIASEGLLTFSVVFGGVRGTDVGVSGTKIG